MKKVVYIISSLLVSLACSRTEHEMPENNSDLQETVEDIIEFSAVFGEAAVVKSELSGTTVLWKEGDEISILWDGGSTTARADKSGASADFTADVAQVSEYYSVYPSAASVSLSEGSLTVGIPAEQNGEFEDVNIAIARTTDRNLVFKNLCALGKITLSRNDIAKIVFKGNGGQCLAGDVTLSLDANGIPSFVSTASPQDVLVLTPASDDAFAAGTYYFAAIPSILEEGVSFTLTTVTGNTIIGKASANPKELVRSEALDFGTLDDITTADALRLRFTFGPEKGAKAVLDPDKEWPESTGDESLTDGVSYTYTIDGIDYGFYVKSADKKFTWRTNNAYADCIAIQTDKGYFGLPAFEGLRLTSVVVGKCRRGKSDNPDEYDDTSTAVGITDCIPDGTESLKTYISGGNLQVWPSWNNDNGGARRVVDHKFTLSETEENTIYYLNSDTPGIGLYFSHLILTYEKPDCAYKGFREDWQQDGNSDAKQTVAENGRSNYAIAYDMAAGNASEFIEAFAKYTGCTPMSYLETSEQNTKEIIIGKTSRQETKSVLSGMTHGFKIAFVGEKLVIAGTDDNWTAVALYEFEKKVLKSSKYMNNGSLTIPEDLNLSESYDDPQMIARLLNHGYTDFTFNTEKVMSCPGEGNVKVAQGAASDGNHVYFVLRNSGDTEAMVFKYDMFGKQVAKSAVFNGGHCNDMTLNTRTSTLYVAHGSAAPKVLTPLAGSNLSIGTDISISVGTGAITYNATRNSYAISQGGKNLILCDADFNKVQGYTRTDDNEYTPQGMGSDDHYVYFPMSSSKDNILVVYDWNGKHVATLKVDLALESESMFYAGGNYYVNFHEKSKGAQLYKVTPVLKYSHN